MALVSGPKNAMALCKQLALDVVVFIGFLSIPEVCSAVSSMGALFMRVADVSGA